MFLGSELLRQSLSIQGSRGRSSGTKRLGSGSERSPGTQRPTQDPETRRTQPGRRHLAEGGVRPRHTKEIARRGWGGGGLCWSRGFPACGSRGQCALSAAAPAGSCSWSGGVWSRRGECVGKPGWGWEMPVPQRFPRGPDLRSWRALPWEPSLAWGRDPSQNHFPAPAPFRSEAGGDAGSSAFIRTCLVPLSNHVLGGSSEGHVVSPFMFLPFALRRSPDLSYSILSLCDCQPLCFALFVTSRFSRG